MYVRAGFRVWCKQREEFAMAYHATWLKNCEVVADDEFADLLEAQAFVLEHMKAYHKSFGANGVKVWDERTTYFQIENPSSEALAAIVPSPGSR
jgi:hypothetical protein